MNKVKITISKTEFEFYFGLGFWSGLKENQGIDVDEIAPMLKDNKLKLIPILMLESARYSAERREVGFKMKLYDFIDAIDDDGGISSEGLVKFLFAFTDSMTKDVPKEPTTKKKVTQKK